MIINPAIRANSWRITIRVADFQKPLKTIIFDLWGLPNHMQGGTEKADYISIPY